MNAFLDSLASPTFLVGANQEVTFYNRRMADKIMNETSREDCFHSLNRALERSRGLSLALADILSGKRNKMHTTIQFHEKIDMESSAIVIGQTSPTGDVTGALCILDDEEHSSDITEPDVYSENDPASQLHSFTNVCTADDTTSGEAYKGDGLFENANIAIFCIDHLNEYMVNQMNQEAASLIGFSGEEPFQASFVDSFVAESVRVMVRDAIRSAANGKRIANLVFDVNCLTGETKTLISSMHVEATKGAAAVTMMVQDITEKTRHEKAVANTAMELRRLIDGASLPIFGVDCDGDINEWNNKAAEITGFPKEEVFDKDYANYFIFSKEQDSVRELVDAAVAGKETSTSTFEIRTKLNGIRHFLVNASPRRDAEGNSIGMLGVAQDITDSVKCDREVVNMATELRQIIETANAPIFGVDAQGNVNEWNTYTQKITGFSKDEALGKKLVQTFIAESMRETMQKILEAALSGEETPDYEVEFLSKTAQVVLMRVNATARHDPELNIVGVVGVAQDITVNRNQTAELRRLEHAQATQEAKVQTERNMTAYFAHELRNPLGAIDCALSAMPDGDLPETVNSLVEGMKLCCQLMASIMNNLLDVRKMEEGKMSLQQEPLVLWTLMRNVHRMLLPSVKPGVSFEFDCAIQAEEWVLGDSHRIKQVFTNVITNAIKYTKSGSITISIRLDGDAVLFECKDTGPGIPKNEQESLFERFVMRGGAPGTGLGLAIAKHIVDLAKGTIRFQSDPDVGPGTVCIVRLPAERCAPPHAEPRSGQVSTLEEKLAILIVDDIKLNRNMLRRRFQKMIAPNGIITEASTGEEALALISGDLKPDIIIMDQFMEEAGGTLLGTETVLSLRQQNSDAIIIGYSGNDFAAEFLRAGADWVWQKPIPSNEAIITSIRQALSEKTTTRGSYGAD